MHWKAKYSVQSTTGKLLVGKVHHSQSTSWLSTGWISTDRQGIDWQSTAFNVPVCILSAGKVLAGNMLGGKIQVG